MSLYVKNAPQKTSKYQISAKSVKGVWELRASEI